MPAPLPADLAAAIGAKQHNVLVVALCREDEAPVITAEIAEAIGLAVNDGWKLVVTSPTPPLHRPRTNPTDDETLCDTGPLLLAELRDETAKIFGQTPCAGYIAANAIATAENAVWYVDAETHQELQQKPAARRAEVILHARPPVNVTAYSYIQKGANAPEHCGNVYRSRMSDLHTFLDTFDPNIIAKGAGVVVYIGKSGDIPTVMQIKQHLLQPTLEDLRTEPVPVFTHALSNDTKDFITALSNTLGTE